MRYNIAYAIVSLFLLGSYLPHKVSAQTELSVRSAFLKPDSNCSTDPNRFITAEIFSMYKNTWLLLDFECPKDVVVKITRIEWSMLKVDCVNSDLRSELCKLKGDEPAYTVKYLQYSESFKDDFICGDQNKNKTLNFPFAKQDWKYITTTTTATPTPTTAPASSVQANMPSGAAQSRQRRDGGPGSTGTGSGNPSGSPEASNPGSSSNPTSRASVQGPPSLQTPGGQDQTQPGISQPGLNPTSKDPSPPSGAPGTGARGEPGITGVPIGRPPEAPSNKRTTMPPDEKTATGKTNEEKPLKGAILRTDSDGFYWFILHVEVEQTEQTKGLESFKVNLMPLATHGQLSAIDFPLLPFYAVMFVLYAIYLIVWVTLCCCYRKDILQVQYWITAVIFLGLMEKAVFLGEFDTMNRTGQSAVYGALIFGEMLSSAKKALSRMLVVVVSFGFGIVKPRLGATLYKVLAMGLIYFLASFVEACLRINSPKTLQSNAENISYLILAIVDVCICWWIFSSLVLTMKTLRLRRNVVKLSLYRHFTNTLIFAVLASVGFMIWTIRQFKISSCIRDWKEIWVDEAFWHLLFSLLLLVIIILWRPSANNQRYAYSHLADAEDDESEEPMMNTAFDGVKMRSKSQQENGSKQRRHGDEETDEDLKWIEENIPTSLADSALPSLLDSDEEIALTQNELRKMH